MKRMKRQIIWVCSLASVVDELGCMLMGLYRQWKDDRYVKGDPSQDNCG